MPVPFFFFVSLRLSVSSLSPLFFSINENLKLTSQFFCRYGFSSPRFVLHMSRVLSDTNLTSFPFMLSLIFPLSLAPGITHSSEEKLKIYQSPWSSYNWTFYHEEIILTFVRIGHTYFRTIATLKNCASEFFCYYCLFDFNGCLATAIIYHVFPFRWIFFFKLRSNLFQCLKLEWK